jgi:rubrerythrin
MSAATRESLAADQLSAWSFNAWPKVWECAGCGATFLIREVTVRCRVCGYRETD